MSIIDLQRRMRQLGKIRAGNQVPMKGGGSRPAKLDTWRLTSPTKELVEAAAIVYGGEVVPWANPGGGPEFEVITTTTTLDIVVPPGQSFGQWYELWSGGGCQRRCDGETNVLTMGPCECPEDPIEKRELAQKGLACKPTSRLNVILPALPDLGTWLLESHGFYAAVELAGSAEFLAIATQAGRLIPARLRLDQREKKVPGKPTNKYAVPVIEFTQTRIADLIGDGQGQLQQLTPGASGAPRLGAPEHPPAPALPEVSGFRAPPASDGPSGPSAPDPGQQLPTATEGDAAAGDPGAAAEAQESEDIDFDDVEAAPRGLTTPEFMRLLGSTDGVTHAVVATTAKKLFDGATNLGALSDEDRARLWDNIESQLPAKAGA